MHPILFSLFDLLFIAFTQSILIFLFSSSPAYVILLTNKFKPELSSSDFGYLAWQLLLVFSEFISDGQQWSTVSFSPPLQPSFSWKKVIR